MERLEWISADCRERTYRPVSAEYTAQRKRIRTVRPACQLDERHLTSPTYGSRYFSTKKYTSRAGKAIAVAKSQVLDQFCP